MIWYHLLIKVMKNIALLNDSAKKRQLQKSIDRKRKILSTITAKFEMLKVELSLIQREYNIRIGRLLLKDNELDFEIIRLNNILRLISEGKTYFEAEVELENLYYNKEEEFKKRENKLDDEE